MREMVPDSSTEAEMAGNVASFAREFSRQVTVQLVAVNKAAQDALRRQKISQSATEAKCRRAHVAREALLAPRRATARQGLKRLKTFAKSRSVQQILRSLAKLPGESYITLFSVERPSGDWWDDPSLGEAEGMRVMVVELYSNHMLFYSGAWNVSLGRGDVGWEFDHDGSVWMVEYRHEKKKGSLPEFWEVLGEFTHPADLVLAQEEDQRQFEWSPDAIAFEFLVSCANKQTLERYVARSLDLLWRTLAA